MTRTTDITNVTEHRQKLRQHLDRVKKSGRPLYITANGETKGVLLSAEAYDELADRADLAGTVGMVRRSEAEIAGGRSVSAREGLRSIARKRGLSVDR